MTQLSTITVALAALLVLPAGAATTLFSQDFNGLATGGQAPSIPGSGFHVVDGSVQARLDAGPLDKYLHLAAGWYAETYDLQNVGDTRIKTDLGFDLQAGQHYTPSFDWSRGPVASGNGPFALTVSALVAGQSVSFNDVSGFYCPTRMARRRAELAAGHRQAGVHLRFIGSGTGYAAAAIDNVRLDCRQPCPSPAPGRRCWPASRRWPRGRGGGPPDRASARCPSCPSESARRSATRVLGTLLAAGLAPAAQAQQGVSLATGLTDFTTWTRLGSASAFNETPGNGFTYSNLVLTQAHLGDQAGAAFAPTALSIDFNQAFRFDVHVFIPASAGLRGDGLAFTLAAAPALGGGGSGLVYEGLGAASVDFAIDTFHFDGEPVSPSLQILQSGSVTPLAATETGLGEAIRNPDFQWFAKVDYPPSGLDDQAGTLTGRIEHLDLGSFEVAVAVDFGALGLAGSPVVYGFSASNGAATDGHWVTSAVPVPEPGSWALMLSGLAGVLSLAWHRRPH